MNFLQAQQALTRKLDIDLDNIAYNGLFTLQEIKDAINEAAHAAWDLKPWTFREGDKKTTAAGSQEQYDYPTDFAADSVWRVTIDGEKNRYDKLAYRDYRTRMGEDPNNTDKIFCEYNEFLFINSNTFNGGEEIVIYGLEQYQTLSADDAKMPFSPQIAGQGYSGNDAIVMFAYADFLASEKLKNPTKGETVRKDAFRTMLEIYEQQKGDTSYSKHPYTPQYSVPDYFATKPI